MTSDSWLVAVFPTEDPPLPGISDCSGQLQLVTKGAFGREQVELDEELSNPRSILTGIEGMRNDQIVEALFKELANRLEVAALDGLMPHVLLRLQAQAAECRQVPLECF